MARDDAVNRHVQARQEEEEAAKRADALASKYVEAARKLGNWRTTGFSHRRANGSVVEPHAGSTSVININDVPSLGAIQ